MVDDLDLMRVLVEVDEEVMAEQVGLDKRVLLGHRLHLDFLQAHEQVVVFLRLGRDDIGDIQLVRLEMADAAPATTTLHDPRLVFAQLARDLVRCLSLIHI